MLVEGSTITNHTKNSSAGFTIVEVVVAISVIAILLPATIVFLDTMRSMNQRASILSVVSAYAENKIERYRSAGFNSVPLTAAPVTYTGADALPQSIPRPNTATYDVELVDVANPALKKITIAVTFRSPNGNETLTFITYLGELGVGQY